ncbi:MAG: ferrous iron transport protein [Tepidanaerobacteraceae bacterium]|nr:ferrous iron transport protein [Tepidanaerobacteraceae bacterium]
MAKKEQLEYHDLQFHRYFNEIEKAVRDIESLLKSDYRLSKRTIALLLLQEDEEIKELVREKEKSFNDIDNIIQKTKKSCPEPIQYIITLERQGRVEKILKEVINHQEKTESALEQWMDYITIRPLTGIPILLLVLYFGLYTL